MKRIMLVVLFFLASMPSASADYLDTEICKQEDNVRELSASEVSTGKYELRTSAYAGNDLENRIVAGYVTNYAPGDIQEISFYLNSFDRNNHNNDLALWYLPSGSLTSDTGDDGDGNNCLSEQAEELTAWCTTNDAGASGCPSGRVGDTLSYDLSGRSETSGALAIVSHLSHVWYEDDYLYVTVSNVQGSTPNSAPDSPSNPSPYNGESDVDPSHNLYTDVSDPDGDSMDVDFYVDGSYEGTDYSVCSGCTASINPSLSYGGSYDWYAVADDGSERTSSSTWSFSTIHQPNAPSNPSPSNNANDVSTSQNLQVDVSHDDGHSMDVDFYLDDGSGYTDVGRDSGVCDGCTASISPSLDLSGDYNWYAIARDSGYSTSSSTWGFQTEHSTSASLYGPSQSPAPMNPTLETTISHSDPNEQVTVEFVNADTGNTVHTVTGVSNGQTVTYDTSEDSFGGSPGTTYNWRVELSGDWASESYTSSSQSFTTVSSPDQPSLNAPASGSSSVSTGQDLNVDVSHPDNLNMNVDFYIDEGQTGSFDPVTTKTGVGDGSISANPSLTEGTSYNWYVQANTDGYGTSSTSSTWSFTTNYVPSVDSITKYGSSDRHAFQTVSAIVSDTDGDQDLVSANLTVNDGINYREYSHQDIDRTYGGSNEANVTFGEVWIGDAGWSLDNIELMVEGIDSEGNVGSRTVSGLSFPNHAPTIASGYSYSESPQNHAFTLNIDAEDVDDGAGEIGSCTVEHRLEAGNETSESGSLNQGEIATCSFTIDDSYSGYDKGDSIEHRVTFTDIHGKSTTSAWNTYTIPNSAPSAIDLQPSGGEVQYGPTLNATYTDPDGDSGSLTFYDNDTGQTIGSVTGLAPGEYGTVEWGAADTPGTTYNFTVEASDGLNATNTTENFTTIYEPKEPYNPNPENESTVDTTTRTDDEIAASVKVVHPDDRPMNVEFINRSNGQIMEIDYNVESGDRAKITNIGNSLRDETNETYKWYARSYDTGTGEYTDSSPFIFHTVEVGQVMFDVMQGDSDNMDVTGYSDNGWTRIEFEITSSQMDPIPVVTINETGTGNSIKTWSNVDNNSVLSVDLEQDGGQDWNLNTDSEYEYFIEASEGPNILGTSLNYTIYTYNTSLSWNHAEQYYNVYQYDLYRAQDAGGDLVFDYGNGDYNKIGSLPDVKFNDSGPDLEPGTFCWKVAASNPSGNSDAIPTGDGKCKTLN